MLNKTYEIRRADMENIKEYSVWKHANEEVWEACDENSFLGEDVLEPVEIRNVMEFDWKGSHYRIYRKEGDTFTQKEYYALAKDVVAVVYHRFSEADLVRITFKDADTDVTPAATLPKGWNWVENLDESGYLESPDGKSHFLYEVQYINTCASSNTLQRIVHHGFDSHICDVFGCLDEKTYGTGVSGFKRMAEYSARCEIGILEVHTLPAATLPRGWNWVLFSNDTGYLEAPNKQQYFRFLINYSGETEIVKYYIYKDNASYNYVEYKEFQKYAERRVRIEIVTPLSMELKEAVKQCDVDKVLKLIEAGADVNYRDEYLSPSSALSYVPNHSSLHIIKLLVEHGADVNVCTGIKDMNILMHASNYGEVSTVKYLLEHNADPSIINKYRHNAARLAKEALKNAHDFGKKEEDYKEIIRLLESTSNEPAKYKFGNAVLPCNELKDFETEDTSVSIPCRIYLTQAPIEQYERAMKEVDGVFYSPYNFFIEGVAMKNKPDDELVIKKWMLFYALENGHVHKFGYVNDVPDTTWDYFKEQMAIGKKTFELCVTWEMCGKVKVKANSLEEAMDIFNNTSDYIKLPEGNYVDGSFQLSTADLDEMAEMTNQISE